MSSILEHFLQLNGYDKPLQQVPDGQRLWIDQLAIDLSEDHENLRLKSTLGALPQDPNRCQELLPQLTWIATARSGEEDWVLSYEAGTKEFFLWGTIDGGSSDEELQESMESFVSSVEWWRNRLQDDADRTLSHSHPVSSNPWDDTGLMMFRP